jgi:hypothetical protein
VVAFNDLCGVEVDGEGSKVVLSVSAAALWRISSAVATVSTGIRYCVDPSTSQPPSQLASAQVHYIRGNGAATISRTDRGLSDPLTEWHPRTVDMFKGGAGMPGVWAVGGGAFHIVDAERVEPSSVTGLVVEDNAGGQFKCDQDSSICVMGPPAAI